MNTENETKKTRITLPVRILAFVLSLIFIAGLVIYNLVPSGGSVESAAPESTEETAVAEAESEDPYPVQVSNLLVDGDYTRAQEVCDTALAAGDEYRAELLFLRCKADFLLEDYAGCREDAMAALEAGYDYTESMTMAAAAYEGEKDYAGVLEILMEMIDSGDADDNIYENALACALEVDDYEAQKKLIVWYLGRENDAETELSLRSQLAMAQLQSGEFTAAEENLNTCLEAEPDNLQLKYLRGVCRMNLGEYLKAHSDFTAVMKAGELVDECHYNRAVCFIALGQTYEAGTELKTIISRNESPEMAELAQELLDKLNGK